MDDELCKECYDCKSVFTAWRRKHHCRICGTLVLVLPCTLCSSLATGQIYCSRCASNIIKGARFGQDGMVRVCNLCLDKLGKVDDDDDDSRSVISSTTSPFAAHQFGVESRSLNLANLPQSPFAASQLFGRHDSFHLFSIAETMKSYPDSDGSGLGSRSISPDFPSERDLKPSHAPFRRATSEDEKEPLSLSLSEAFRADHTPLGNGSKTPIDFPVTVPVSVNGSTSSVAFPVSSPDQSFAESPGGIRSRYNSFADLHGGAPPFLRNRVQSRLGESEIGEPGWRTRRESTA